MVCPLLELMLLVVSLNMSPQSSHSHCMYPILDWCSSSLGGMGGS